MKLKELTKEQRASIEADELGKEILNEFRCKLHCKFCTIRFFCIEDETQRTIKRIDDEIYFLENTSVYQPKELLDSYFPEPISKIKEVWIRIDKLRKQKQLYELMEQLE